MPLERWSARNRSGQASIQDVSPALRANVPLTRYSALTDLSEPATGFHDILRLTMTDVSRRARNLLVYLCLALVTAGVYWPVRHFAFAYYDDPMCVTGNQHVQEGFTSRALVWAFTTPLDQWMPVTWLARILDYRLFGLSAGAHHLVNVFFHIVNTLLLFGVLKRMTGAPWRSAGVAALFALHPLHVESVAWVTGLKDVLSTCLGLLTIWAYVRYVEEFNSSTSSGQAVHSSQLNTQGPRPGAQGSTLCTFYGLTLLLFASALMAKPMMVTLPFVLWLLDYWPLGRTRWARPAAVGSGPATGEGVTTPVGRLLREKLPFFALAAASCAMTYWAQRSLGAVVSLERIPLGIRLANALLSYVGYLSKAIWPTGLAFLYPLDTNLSLATAMVAGLGLVGVTVAVIRGVSRWPWLAMGWFWYLGTLVPVIGLVHVGVAQALAERYTYVPLVGPFIMLCWSVPNIALERRAQKMVVTTVTAVLLGVYAVLCRVQVDYWKDSESLFHHALQVTKRNWIAHNNLGLFLWHSGRTPEAIEQYEQALQLKPYYAEAHHNLGLALMQLSRMPEAIQHFEQVVRIKPDSAEAHRRLGLALRQAGHLPEAVGQFEQAVRMNPGSAETHNDLGNALLQAGKLKHATAQYQQALDIEPDLIEVENNLAWLLATLAPTEGGDPARAVTLARRACDLTNNQMAEYLDTLGVAYAAAGRFTDAIGAAQTAIELGRSAGKPELVREIEARLELYRSGRAYRSPRTPVASPRTP